MRLLTPGNLGAIRDRFAPKYIEIPSIDWAVWARPLTLRQTMEIRARAFGDKKRSDQESEWTYMLQVFAASICLEDGTLAYTAETVESLRDDLTWEEALTLFDEIGKANRLRSTDIADAEKNSASSPSADSSSP